MYNSKMVKTDKELRLKPKPKIFYWYIILILIYAGFTFLTAPPKATLAKYHLTSTGLRLLDITVVLPVVGIWFAAFYGYYKLNLYSKLIAHTKDGKQILILTKGIFILTLGLPLTSIAKQILTLIADHHHAFTNMSIIISNYVALLFPLVAFFVISQGARGLSRIAKKRTSYVMAHLFPIFLIIIGVLYGYLVANSNGRTSEAYHLPSGWVLATLVIPYIYTWFLGLVAAYNLHLYSGTIKGIVFRRGWDLLAYGLGSVILISVLIQYLTTVTNQFQSLSLNWILLVVYILLILLAAGYVLLALGAKKLIRIEEV